LPSKHFLMSQWRISWVTFVEMKVGNVVFIFKINCPPWILKGYGIIWKLELDRSLSKCQNYVWSRIQTSFSHSRITFFLNFELKKLINQTNFHVQKSVWDFDPPIKNNGQNLEMMIENVKNKVSFNPSVKIVHNFWLED